MKNKKAQGMSTNTIILLILGLAVLVVLILGFTTGWKAFNSVINPTNVDDVVEECSSVCGLKQEYSFCSGLREYRINEEDLRIKASCAVLATEPSFSGYVSECGAINCELECSQIIIENEDGNKLVGEIGSEVPEGAYDVTQLASGLSEGEVCFIQ